MTIRRKVIPLQILSQHGSPPMWAARGIAELPRRRRAIRGMAATRRVIPEIQVPSFCGKGISLSPVGALWMNALLP
jgi:hypothetical protein